MYKNAIMHILCVLYIWVCVCMHNIYNYKYIIFMYKWDMYTYFDCNLAIIKTSLISTININVNNNFK